MKKKQKHYFDIAELSRQVNVEKPYFAFQQLWTDNGALVGTFSPEQPLVHESGPVTAGELGRHMAILGSCTAVALHEGATGYYLATSAHFIRRQHHAAVTHEKYYASARVLELDKRSLKVSAQVWNSEPVAEVICDYVILSPAVFKRNFRHYAAESPPAHLYSPYTQPVPVHSLTFQPDRLDACAGPLTPDQCAGHFSGYPCWPLAIISQTALQVTGELLIKKYGAGTRFCVQEAKLSAEKLLGAGSMLTFRIQITPVPENTGLLQGTIRVYHDDEPVAHMESRLALLPAG
ncbi:hypothetical protein Q5384_20240 [Enterobacter ludwigii]|uniref:hypothetical protein n=1 Tax=Enterobacter ludwigii TaxID=299767 RepID=UPI002B4C0B8E|nr:hypothetical protein [Enterobacter ludwigii]WRM04088.1 hypothetical protein Q5384_20240 [Enterobacter ludwigii]